MTVGAIAAPTSRVRATQWIVPLLVAVLAVRVASWAWAPYLVGVFHDDGVYALLARAIASGNGFHYTQLPGAPAATHYPPLYPLMLAAAWRIAPDFPHSLSTLLGLNSLCVGAAAVGWWRFATARLGWNSVMAGAAALVATLGSPTLALSGALLSESLFIALLWPALLLCEREVDDAHGRLPWRAGLAIGVLMLVRTHALALLVAVVVVLGWHWRWRSTACVAVVAGAVQLPWLLWAHGAAPHVVVPLEGAYGSYLGWFRTGVVEGGAAFLLATTRANALECWLLLRDRFALGAPAPLLSATAMIVLVAIIFGGISMARRASVTVLFLAAYVTILVAWPYAPWRFLWAVWPVVILFALEGIRRGCTAAGRWRIIPVLAATLPALAFVRTELHAYATRGWRAPARQASEQIAPALAWIRMNTVPTDVVLGEGESVLSLYGDRQAAPPMSFTAREYLTPPDTLEGRARLGAMLAAVPARYVLSLMPATQQAARALATTRPALREIARLPASRAVVFEVVR
jgi:hypothetical protein